MRFAAAVARGMAKGVADVAAKAVVVAADAGRTAAAIRGRRRSRSTKPRSA